RDGRLLTEKPLADTFLAGWTSDGKNLICYRDYEAFLVSLDGARSKYVHIPTDDFITPERVTYLPSIDALVWMKNGFADMKDPLHTHIATIRSIDKDIVQKNSHLGDMLVPSPDNRYIAAIDVTNWIDKQLWVFDTQNKTWANLGKATVHPDIIYPNNDWDGMKAYWNPWSTDSSHLVFISGSSVAISTPDGKDKQTITRLNKPAGLAVASPDAKQIAYVTFDVERNKEQPQWTFWGNTTIWVVSAVAGAQARAVTKKSSDTTYCLQWLNANELVFDRVFEFCFNGHARLWKALVN